MSDSERYLEFPHWGVLKRRLVKVCVNTHGQALRARFIGLGDAGDEAVVAAVREWLDQQVLRDLWARRRGIGRPMAEEEAEEAEEDEALNSGGGEGWAGWGAAISLFSNVEGLAKRLQDVVDPTGLDEKSWNSWLYRSIGQYLSEVRAKSLPDSERKVRNWAVLERAARQLRGENPRLYKHSPPLAAALALMIWRREIDLYSHDFPLPERGKADEVPDKERTPVMERIVVFVLTYLHEFSVHGDQEELERLPALSDHVPMADELDDCIHCERCPTALDDEERLVVRHKLERLDPPFINDKAFLAHHDMSQATFQRRYKAAKRKLAECLTNEV